MPGRIAHRGRGSNPPSAYVELLGCCDQSMRIAENVGTRQRLVNLRKSLIASQVEFECLGVASTGIEYISKQPGGARSVRRTRSRIDDHLPQTRFCRSELAVRQFRRGET